MEPEIDVFGTQTSAAAMAFGLRGVADWSVQQPFLDVFKTARPWYGHTADQWGAYMASDLDAMGALDANGWITEIPAGIDRIESFILTEMPAEATYTGGLYRLSYDGAGNISLFGAEIVSRADGEIWFDYRPTGENMVAIIITDTDPQNTGDYLRNIQVVKQEHIPAHEAGQLFNPLWLDVIDDAHALRFMDWQETNNSTIVSWSDRPQEGHYTYHGGVPVEVMVALANATGTEPWFNIPWDADDTYIRNFATYVRDHLDPDLRAHIELSNEVWNWMFDQARDAAQSALDRFGRDIGDGWVQEYGARSVEMAGVLDDVFVGAEDRLVKVIATHTYWPGLEEALLIAPAWQALSPANTAPHLSFDTYAITGYFGNSLGTDAKAPTVLQWISQSEAQARRDAAAQGLHGSAADAYFAEHRYDLAENLAVRELRDGSVTGDAEDSLQGLFELFRYHKSVADMHGLDLVMYEGGTHVVGIGQWTGNAALTDFFTHLNYSDGMGQLYTELLAGWASAGGTLFNAFVDVSEPSQWGSWGSLRHLEDDTARHDAVVDFMHSHPAPEHMKDGVWNSEPIDFGPVPSPEADPSPSPEPEPEPEAEASPQPDPEPQAAPPSDPDPVPEPATAPTNGPDGIREYVFGNSLFVWATGNPEQSVAYWMDIMADGAGKTYAAAMQTGMLTQHDNLPARPHIGIEGVTDPWDPDTGQSFSDARFNQITISPVNFVQDQPPDSPYWIDPSTSPRDSALRIIDWAEARAPGAAINLYETWPEMAGFIRSFPPTASEFAAWSSYLTGEWHDWWASLYDMIQDARPDLEVRLISVGPQISGMIENPALGLSGLSPSDLFMDDGPHGTPTLYFLASMIHYTALYGEAAPAGLELPESIHPAVAENVGAISAWLASNANGFSGPVVDGFSDASVEGPFEPPDSFANRDGVDTPLNHIFGTNSDVHLTRSGTAETFSGGSGDDTIHGGGGRDVIDGGTGTDTAVFTGNQSQYTLFLAEDHVGILDRSRPDYRATTLHGVELIDFEQNMPLFDTSPMDITLFDGMARLDGASMAALTELYIAYFNRAPDAIGLFYWGDQLVQGASMEQIAAAFFDQPETRAVYGSLDDLSAFVTTVYQNVLGREPDAQGMNYWVSLLEGDSDVQPATFIQAILDGAKAVSGDPADAAYLANKVLLGGHFAITRGMSDIDDAQMVMLAFDGTTNSLAAGIAQTDAIYEDALAPENGGFLMQLVGIYDDPFTM
jgi:hypothetical protein